MSEQLQPDDIRTKHTQEWQKVITEIDAITLPPDERGLHLLHILKQAAPNVTMYDLLCFAAYLNMMWLTILDKYSPTAMAVKQIKKEIISYHYTSKPWEGESNGVQLHTQLDSEGGELSNPAEESTNNTEEKTPVPLDESEQISVSDSPRDESR